MFCMNCGTKFEGKFCPECGTKVSEQNNFVERDSSSTNEIEELNYLRGTQECLLLLSNEYTKIIAENVKEIRAKKELESFVKTKKVLEQQALKLENEYKDKIKKIEEEINQKRFENKISKSKAALGVYTMGLSLFVTGINKKAKVNDTEMKKLDEELKNKKEIIENELKNNLSIIEGKIAEVTQYTDSLEEVYVENYNKNMDIIKTSVNEILNSEKWKIAKAYINPAYLNIDAIPRLIEFLTYGRVSTWKEACNLYEDELFKLQMIDIGERQLSVQEDLLAAQKDLVELSIESINMQQISLELQKAGLALQQHSLDLQERVVMNTAALVEEAIATNEYHQVLIKEMTKIQKNTKCSKKVAQISAFVDFNSIFFAKKVHLV